MMKGNENEPLVLTVTRPQNPAQVDLRRVLPYFQELRVSAREMHSTV